MQLSMWFAPADSEAHAVVAAPQERLYRLVEGFSAGPQPTTATWPAGRRLRRHLHRHGPHLDRPAAWTALARLDEALTRRAVHQFEHGIYS